MQKFSKKRYAIFLGCRDAKKAPCAGLVCGEGGRLSWPMPPGCDASPGSEGVLLAAQLGQRVLQYLDQLPNVLWRHLNPRGRDGQASGCLGCVLETDERLAVLNASANAGELEQGCRSHTPIVHEKSPHKAGFVGPFGLRSVRGRRQAVNERYERRLVDTKRCELPLVVGNTRWVAIAQAVGRAHIFFGEGADLPDVPFNGFHRICRRRQAGALRSDGNVDGCGIGGYAEGCRTCHGECSCSRLTRPCSSVITRRNKAAGRLIT